MYLVIIIIITIIVIIMMILFIINIVIIMIVCLLRIPVDFVQRRKCVFPRNYTLMDQSASYYSFLHQSSAKSVIARSLVRNVHSMRRHTINL